jgi:hypothetical protein
MNNIRNSPLPLMARVINAGAERSSNAGTKARGSHWGIARTLARAVMKAEPASEREESMRREVGRRVLEGRLCLVSIDYFIKIM